MNLLTVYGSPTPPGKLARALGRVEDDVRARQPGWAVDRLVPEPTADPVVALWGDDAVERVRAADAVILASPVFCGSFTGTLKLLVDALPNDALRNKPVGILTVAAAPHHFLSAERHLRDVLAWFGALTAPNGAFFVDRTFASDDVAPDALAELRELVEQVTVLAERLPGHHFGPDPLHVRFTRPKAADASAPATRKAT
ncbi:NADPH-dependent FMN reductase [Prescottella equi]|uniref:NADPH-dependent FMN reductase n=1 Tax=Rhodococcus hoagii TaxID=43767 RepID=UPI0023DAAC5E|nr:NAD(P)H-dependent oxidoreductase [Prescottella equi]